MTNERFTNPFPGLRPFESNEDHLFFGRDGQSDELLRRLRRSRFLAVLGTSGSGKSSLVRAGMLPSLYGGLMTDAGSSWRVALFRPGHNPIGNLAKALSNPQVLGSGDVDDDDAALQRTIVEATLRRSALGLVEATRQARMPANENLLVVVDQFEEIFRFRRMSKGTGPEDESAAFIKLLLEAKKRIDVPVYIVITMRSDFLGDCAQFRDLPEAINDGQYLIPRMTRDQRREAITGPVAVGGGEIAGRLVNRLLNDVGDDPDHLPILQHALMRTWDLWRDDRRNGEPIDLRHYEAVGTMTEALSRHADEAYAELPNDRSRALADKLFKSLTEKGSDNREIRRPTRVSEIAAIAEATPAEIIAVIEPFRQSGRSFLMPPASVALDENSLIDISHESLIRGWTRLRKWVDEEARSANIYRRIADTALLHAEGRAGLWHDPDLALALRWREENRPNATWAEHYHPEFERAMAFIDASKTANEAEIAERERRRRRDVRRSRIFVSVLAIAFLISLGFLYLANTQRVRAEEQNRIAETQRKIAEAATRDAQAQKTRAETSAEEARREATRATAATEEAKKQAEIAEAAKVSAQKQAQIAEARRKEAQLASEREQAAQLVSNQRRIEAERAAFRVRQQNLSDKSTIEFLADRLIALSSPQEAATWRLQKASALTQLGRHPESMAESTGMLKYFPDNLWASVNRGYMNLILDEPRPEEALKDFNRALELEPRSSLNYLNVGVTQAMLKQYDTAIDSISKAIHWYRPMIDEGAFESAVSEDITKATHRSVIITDGPATITAYYYELANLHAFKGSDDFERVIREADRQAAKAGSPVEGYLTGLNWAWLQTRHIPTDYGALASQGHLWRQAGFNDWSLYYFKLFECKHRELKDSRYDGIAKWVSRQLNTLPRNASITCAAPPHSEPDLRARIFEADELAKTGRADAAVSLLTTGLEKDPDNIELLLKRAQYYQWSSNNEKSKQDFEHALKLTETNPAYQPFVYWYWGILGKSMGALDDNQVGSYLRKALELGPANSEILTMLSDLEAKTNPDEAIKLLQRSLTVNVSADTYHKLAKLQNDNRRFKEGAESINMAIALAPDVAEYYEERERAEEQTGVSEVERKRRLAEGFIDIGNNNFKQRKLVEAYPAYQRAQQVLSAIKSADQTENVRSELATVNLKLASVRYANREKVYGRIVSIKDGAGKTREVMIDRGSDDGVVAGEGGLLWAIYSKVEDKERDVQEIGTARVLSVDRTSATVQLTMADPTGDKLVRVGDMVEVSAGVPPLAERPNLWRLTKFHIVLTSEDGKKTFADYRMFYHDRSTENVNRILDEIVAEIKSTAARISGADEVKIVITKGRFKGKTMLQVMQNPTREDVQGLFDYISQNPWTYYGQDVKVVSTFWAWAIGQPE